MVEFLVEMATVNSYNTPIALLTTLNQVVELLFSTIPKTHSDTSTSRSVSSLEMSTIEKLQTAATHSPNNLSQFEQSIRMKLRTAEGEERWRLVTQLAVVSKSDFAFADELTKAENEAQALFILSLHSIQSTPRLDLHLESNLDAFDRVIEFAGRFDNLALVPIALAHIVDTTEKDVLLSHLKMPIHVYRKQGLIDLVLNTLCFIDRYRREGVEEGCAVGKDEISPQLLDLCLTVLRFLMKFESFDSFPAIDPLVSLAVTTDLSLLRYILRALQEIEERTRNTTTPFSISTATAPYRSSRRSAPRQSADFPSTLGITIRRFSKTAKSVCFVLEEMRACSTQTLTFDDLFEISLDQKESLTTPQQLFETLFKMVLPDDPFWISASRFLQISPFLSQILAIVVPASPDRVEIRSVYDEHSQLLNMILSLVLSLFHTGTPSTLSTPPLSSLLSVLSVSLVRLDKIPSSLRFHIRFFDMFSVRENQSNPTVRQIVLALSEEGMEDRSNLVLPEEWMDSVGVFSFRSFTETFLNKWKGANAQHQVD
ncbi:hypothetical protein BLNAU_19775 [Blattamonas nauphoetae]|uniref:Uncharacterized protein n=1 Tax=Blattamonas nauphoetae TaxID=2049346 RepID=A0ABQ9X0I8_9EUKA|nr:hypothetical protein BLNAU_19775 [Blattamonas nauphoetae]